MNGSQRRRNRRNKERQHGSTLEKRAQSAETAGVSRGPAVSSHTKSCPAQLELERLKMAHVAKQAPARYDPCEIKSLTITMTAAGGPSIQPIPIAGPRRQEPASTDERSYTRQLADYDLILEALSNAEADGKEPLKIKAKAVDACSHTLFSPAHPITMITGADAAPVITNGGAEAAAEVKLERTALFAPATWGRIWPFGTNDPANWVVYAGSCGNPPAPQKSVGWLSALVPVFPYEEWSITMGVGKVAGRSLEAEHNRHGQEGTGSVDLTYKKEHGSLTEQTEVKFRDRSISVEQKSTKADAMKLSTFTTGTETELSLTKKGKLKVESDDIKPSTEAKKITVQWKVGGQEAEFKAGEFINQMLKFAEVVKDITKLFGKVKIGWSVGANISLLEGSLHMKWGHRWPHSYVEKNRVYHVERFFGIGGDCKFVSAAIEGMAGLDITTWTGDSIVGKLAAKVEFNLSVAADVERVWTSATAPIFNDDKGGKDVLLKCAPKISLEGSIGLEAGGFVLGYGVKATAKVTAKFEVTAELSFSWQHGPFGTSSGKVEPLEAKIEVKKASGSVIWTSSPWTIIEGAELWTDKRFFGGA